MSSALEAECKQVLSRILTDRPRGTLPKAVTEKMLIELKCILAQNLDDAAVARLSGVIEERLIHDMWRSRDEESQERLVDWLMYLVRTEARLNFVTT